MILSKLKILIIGGSGTIGSKIIEQFQSSNIIFDYTFLTNPIPSKIGYMLDITNRKNTLRTVALVGNVSEHGDGGPGRRRRRSH